MNGRLRCWRLDKAPSSYTLPIGAIIRPHDNKPPSDCTWDNDSGNWVDLAWTLVPDPSVTDGAA